MTRCLTPLPLADVGPQRHFRGNHRNIPRRTALYSLRSPQSLWLLSFSRGSRP
jgi:hypothetical protein